MMLMMNERDDCWSDLQFDLLAQIIDKVTTSFSLVDYIRFGSICLQWRSFFIQNYEQIKLSNLPILLLPSFNHYHHSDYQNPEEVVENDYPFVFRNYYNPKVIWLGLDHNQRHRSTRKIYSLSERKVYDFELQVPSYMNCRSSSHGWLVLVEESLDGTTYPVHLLNPFRLSNNTIQLPPLNPANPITSPVNNSFFLEKAVFNRNPSSSSSLFQSNPTTNTDDDDDFVVLGLYGDSRMGFCRPGERVWTSLPSPQAIPYRSIFDVIWYKGQFWGILQNGTAFAFDIAPEPKVTIVVDPHPEDDPGAVKRYIVESAGDLFNVRRNFYFRDDDVHYSTVGFQVFKLDQTKMEWVKTNTLDGRMFFLGNNTSLSLFASNYIPESSCKPNSIYFTDDYEESYNSMPWTGPRDMGVFNLEDGSIEPHYIQESKTIMPAAIWIQPMFW